MKFILLLLLSRHLLCHAGSGPGPEVTCGKYFSDVELIKQDGEKVRFYSDVLKNKVVVINTFFTTCTSICPPMNRNFEKIQEALGDRLGKEVFLVSITVDPETDTQRGSRNTAGVSRSTGMDVSHR